jgi:DNA polymerase-3 subunit gamma/tau
VVRALRNAVINGREGQAYLFSGPRGTGKTTTARILAKVLNCENPVEGEPCGECESCRAVDMGNSYDVLELDAASNNGVQEIRDLIESAALSSPGRHRVFILDEVHMLSKAAEAALLKTLEEPPEHVVFVLATTDPQKVSETIRSRVQHLQFHLLPIDQLNKYVCYVIAEAGLTVSDDAIDMVLRQGGGSARDTLSALELVVSGGAELDAPRSTDELIEGLANKDQGMALSAIAHAVQQGRDPRTLAEDIVRAMRDMFLSVMAPELVQLPEHRLDEISKRARSLGTQTIVKVMETLGETMVEMRHAPDTRLLLEVAIVKLAAPEMDASVDNLLSRIQNLEAQVRDLKEHGVASALPPAPVNPETGRAKLGGRAAVGSAATGPIARPAVAAESPAPAPSATPASVPAATSAAPAEPGAVTATPTADPAQAWPQVIEALRGLAKALFKPASVASVEGNVITVCLPGTTPVKKAEESSSALAAAFKQVCGANFKIVFTQDATASQGIARTEEMKRTIVEEVAEDIHAPIDPNDIMDIPADGDPALDALANAFPSGSVQEAPKTKKK